MVLSLVLSVVLSVYGGLSGSKRKRMASEVR